MKDKEKVKYILVTDVGSTTTKARFFKKKEGEYRYVASGEAPTTVEAPFEDVTMGVRNAVREVEELTGHELLAGEGIIMPGKEGQGVDIYVTTSSAGGGLQMLVAGVIKTMTAESAERAALGAGAIVMDIVAIDDNREAYQKIQRMRSLRPDMILLAGGTDGGTITHVTEIAELIDAAEPTARFGIDYKVPIVYCGNKEARKHIDDTLGKSFALKTVDNIRPVLEIENTEPARRAVHELFMEHVMSHAPGYNRLMKWTDIPIMPTPAGEGMMMQTLARVRKVNVLGVGLGGATTNIYSVYDEKFVRSVSANLGMSYSVCNVLKEAGIGNIMRWIPLTVEETDVRNMLRNKMVRPTTIPQTLEELMIEHAVAREAIRLGFKHHKMLARGLRGIRRERSVGDAFHQDAGLETYIDLLNISVIVGTGGLLSHAPRRAQSMLILMDAFQPEGVTGLAQDSVFMIPHLGVLSSVHPEAALEIFEKDCLIRLGTCIAPKGIGSEGEQILNVKMKMPDGNLIEDSFTIGTIKRFPLKEGEKAKVEMKPTRKFDVGAGNGHVLEAEVEGGVVGVVIDARGRPFTLPEDEKMRKRKLREWFKALDAYPNKGVELD